MTESESRNRNWVIVLLLALLAVAALTLIISGGIYYTLAIQTWLESGYTFKGWGMIDWIVGIIGAAAITVGLILAGIFLRLVKWPLASLCSLWLSIVTTAFVLCTYLVFIRIDPSREDVEPLLLLSGSIFQMLAVALPPFLHWLNDRRAPAAAMVAVNEPSRTP